MIYIYLVFKAICLFAMSKTLSTSAMILKPIPKLRPPSNARSYAKEKLNV